MEQNIDWSKLSKKERKKLAKELKKNQFILNQRKSNFGKWFGIAIVVSIILGGIAWIALSVSKESSKPLPGSAIALLGRNHLSVGTKVKYNSNPPTSGDHYAQWIKSGVQEKVEQDEYLVHSLEHGYVIISHNCEIKSQISNVKSQKEGTGSATMDKECISFVSKLKDRVKKDSWKMIVIPRRTLDTNFALTAWGRIDKFNTDKASMERVNNFIEAFRNNGPEQTME